MTIREITNIVNISIETNDVPEFLDNDSTLSTTLWFSGCSLHCEGCYNYMIQDEREGYSMAQVKKEIFKKRKLTKWLTLLGGEPLNSDRSIKILLYVCRLAKQMDYSIFLYTGFEYDEAISRMKKVLGEENVDELKDAIKYIKTGKYDKNQLKDNKNKYYFFETVNQKIFDFKTGEAIYFYDENNNIICNKK